MVDDFERAREIFLEAAALDPAARSAFLETECADQPELRAEVEALLPYHDHPQSVLEPLSGRRPEQIGSYRILDVLGSGGMGIVYLAEQANPRRTVALKVLRPGMIGAKILNRFTREAEILGRLAHPGIARIFDAGMDGDGPEALPYFVMERIEGGPITDFARSQRLDTRQRLKLFIRVCDAVAHAHDHGVIHRDLKPSNILVSEEDGSPKVLDFGVARLAEGDDDAGSLRTETGQLIGTLPYMSPEQVSGDTRDLDGRSDVYALGVLLYQLLCEQLPLDLTALSQLDAARKIRDEDPTSISEHRPELKGDVETILETALRKDRATRYATVQAFADDIRRHLNDEVITARPASALYKLKKFTRRHRALVGGVSIAFFALLVGLVASVRFGMIANVERAAAMRRSYRMGLAAAQSAILDGQMLVAQRLLEESPPELRGWEWKLLSAAIGTNIATWSSGPEQGTAVTVTSDDRSIGALCAQDALVIRDLDTGEILHELREHGTLTRPTLSKDGTHVAAFSMAQDRLFVFDLVSGATALSLPIEHEFLTPVADFSADGHRVAVSTRRDRLTILETATARVVQQLTLAPTDRPYVGVRMRPDGEGVFAWRKPSYVAYLDLTTGQDYLFNTLFGIGAPAWDPAGETLWLNIAGELFSVRPPSFEPLRSLTHSGAATFDVSATVISPDGTRCAIGATGRISIFDLVTNTAVRHLRNDEGHILDLEFDPSGNRLLVAQPGRIRIHSLDKTSSMVLRGHESFVYHAAFSPDGQLIASQDFAGETRIWERNGKLLALIDGTGIDRDADRDPVRIGFSRDGRRVLDLRPGTLRTVDIFTEQILLRDEPSESSGGLPNRELFAIQAAGGANESRSHGRPTCTDPDELICAEGNRRGLSVRDLASGEVIAHPVLRENSPSWVSALAIDSERRWLAYGDSGGVLRLWDLKRDRLLAEIPDAADELFAVAFHPDGRRLVSGGRDGIVRIWDTEQWELVAEFSDHTDYIHDLKFSPDGSQLISASGDKTLRLWDIRAASERAAEDQAAQHAKAAIRPRVTALLQGSNDLDVAHRRMESGGWSDEERSAARRVITEEYMRNGRVQFDPPGGNHKEPVALRLSTPSARSRVHYTLDGSEPTADSPVYVDPLRLSDRTQVSARAFSFGVPGPVASHYYAFDPFAIALVGPQWKTWAAGESAWVFNHGILRQHLNAGLFWPTRPEEQANYYGTMRIHGDPVSDDGEFRVRMRAEDDDAMGIAFRFQSLRKHYLFHWNSEPNTRWLIRRDGDEYKLLASNNVPHERSRWYDVKVVLDGSRISVHVDGEEVLSAVDDTYPSGTFALHTARCTNVDFAELAFEPRPSDDD